MNIIVCVKQVPATTNVQIDPQTGRIIREGVEAIINPFDEYALEEGIRLKEKFGGKVTAISMGPAQVETALRECIARGADETILLSDTNFAGADTLATAYTLACAIKKLAPYDLIVCGKQAIDGDTAQVGPGVAEKLGIPHVCYVRKIREIKDGSIWVERLMEDGYDILFTSLPALITVVKEVNVPRLPSLRGMTKAKKAKINIWNAETISAEKNRIGLTSSPTTVKKVFTPPTRSGGETVAGPPEEQAKILVTKLKELKIL